MVRLEVGRDSSTVLFVDGFCSQEPFYRGFDLKTAEISGYGHMETGRISRTIAENRIENQLRRKEKLTPQGERELFVAMVHGARNAFCPYQIALPRTAHFADQNACAYWPFEHMKNQSQLRNLSFRNYVRDHMSYIALEGFELPEERRLLYVQNLVIAPQLDGFRCEHVEDCMANWMDMTRFEPRADGSYADRESFQQAWEAIIGHMVSRHEGLPPYARWMNRY